MTPEVKSQIARIVNGGAILFIRNVGEMLPLLVGALDLLDDRRLFVFKAFGEDEFAGHVVEFSLAEAPHANGVSFIDAAGGMAAYLCPIVEADMDDAAEQAALASWAEWQTKREAVADFINQTRETLS